jgi:hypothetical protein
MSFDINENLFLDSIMKIAFHEVSIYLEFSGLFYCSIIKVHVACTPYFSRLTGFFFLTDSAACRVSKKKYITLQRECQQLF